MTEDDTFKRLKGLTYYECLEMYTDHYLKFVRENPSCTRDDGWRHTDGILKQYGWTCKSMEKYGLDNNLV